MIVGLNFHFLYITSMWLWKLNNCPSLRIHTHAMTAVNLREQKFTGFLFYFYFSSISLLYPSLVKQQSSPAIHVGDQIPGFSLAQPWLLKQFGKWTLRWKILSRSLPLCFFILISNSAFQMSQSFFKKRNICVVGHTCSLPASHCVFQKDLTKAFPL